MRNSFLINFLLILAPFVLLGGLFGLQNESILNFLKIIIFILSLFLVPLHYWNLKNKLNLYIFFLFSYIVFLTILYREIDDIQYSILYVLPFLLFLNRKDTFHIGKLYIKYIIGILFIAFIYVLVMPKILLAGRVIFTPMMSGPHTTSYAIILLYFITFLIYLNRQISTYIFSLVSLISLYVVFGYKARNAELGIILFFATYFFYESRFSKSLKHTIVFFSFVSVILCIFLISIIYNPDWNEISSGRLFVWAERFDILSNYDFFKAFFGSGYGADLMITKQWWWEAKASHNDFLSLVFNSGLISLIIMVIIFGKLFVLGNSFQKALIIFVVITSATNTGLLGRPILFLYFSIVYILANNLHRKFQHVK